MNTENLLAKRDGRWTVTENKVVVSSVWVDREGTVGVRIRRILTHEQALLTATALFDALSA